MDDSIHSPRRVCIAAAVLLLSWCTLAPTPAHAARMFSGRRLVVAERDTIHDDVYVSGGNLTVRGVIDGDVVVAGGQVGVNGSIKGSVLAAGGRVEIYGDVAGSVRAAGGRMTIGAQIGHDLVVAGGEIDILPDARIGRDALLAGGRVTVEGEIDRNAHIGVGQLKLGSQAMIGGDLDYASDRDAIRMSSAIVKGKTTWYASDWDRERKTPLQVQLIKLWWLTRFAVGTVMLGLMFILVFPRTAQRSIEKLATQPFPSALAGLLVIVGMPVGALFLLCLGFLIGGWWVGAFLLAAWLISMVLGLGVAAMTLGRWLGAKLGARGLAMGWSLLLGAALFLVVRMVPWAGQLLVWISTLAGLGALGLTMAAAIAEGRKADRA